MWYNQGHYYMLECADTATLFAENRQILYEGRKLEESSFYDPTG